MNRGAKGLWAAGGILVLGCSMMAPALASEEQTKKDDAAIKNKKVVVIRGEDEDPMVWVSDGDEDGETMELKGGYLGVNVREETEGSEGGARVTAVVPDSPAAKAGLQKGDVIVGMDGKAIRGPAKLTELIHASTPGDDAVLDVLRDGKRTKVQVEFGKRPRSFGFSFWGPDEQRELERSLESLEKDQKLKLKMSAEAREEARRAMEDARRAMEGARRELADRAPELEEHMKALRHVGPGVWTWSFSNDGRPRLGVELVETTPELRQHLGGSKEAGVLVGRVLPDSAAAKAGLAVGDLIVDLDGTSIEDASDLIEAVADHAGKTVDLKVVRDGRSTTLKVTLPEDQGDDEPRGPRARLAPIAPRAPMAPMPPAPPAPAVAPRAPLPPPPPAVIDVV